MTNNSPLEENIKEKFENYSPEVPPHIWENIMANKERRKPVGFWFSFLNRNFMLLFFGIALSTAFILYKTVFSTEKNKIISTENPVAQINNSLERKPEINSTVSNNNNIPLIENNSSKENRVINNTIITTPGNDISLPGKNKQTSNNKNNFSVTTSENDIENITEPITKDNTNKNRSNKRSANNKGLAAISVINSEASSDEITEENLNNLLLTRLTLNPEFISSKNILNTSINKINNPHLDIPCPKAEKNAAGNKRYVEMYAGPDYAFRNFTDTANSTYLQKRKESTSFTSAFSAGFRYTKVFSNGMSIRTGINYSQINEKFKFAEANIIQKIYIINSNGDTTGSYTATGTRYKTTFNKYRTFDIPLSIGYELGNGRLHANFNAGVILNLYSWQQGDVLDTSYKPINITTGKTSSPYQYRTNIGIGFIGAVSVYYKLNDKWHIFAEPYFRYNLSPSSKSELTLKQKYHTTGLRLGVRLDF